MQGAVTISDFAHNQPKTEVLLFVEFGHRSSVVLDVWVFGYLWNDFAPVENKKMEKLIYFPLVQWEPQDPCDGIRGSEPTWTWTLNYL